MALVLGSALVAPSWVGWIHQHRPTQHYCLVSSARCAPIVAVIEH